MNHALPFPALATVVRYFASVANDQVIWEEFRANLHQLAPGAEENVMTLATASIPELVLFATALEQVFAP